MNLFREMLLFLVFFQTALIFCFFFIKKKERESFLKYDMFYCAIKRSNWYIITFLSGDKPFSLSPLLLCFLVLPALHSPLVALLIALLKTLPNDVN